MSTAPLPSPLLLSLSLPNLLIRGRQAGRPGQVPGDGRPVVGGGGCAVVVAVIPAAKRGERGSAAGWGWASPCAAAAAAAARGGRRWWWPKGQAHFLGRAGVHVRGA